MSADLPVALRVVDPRTGQVVLLRPEGEKSGTAGAVKAESSNQRPHTSCGSHMSKGRSVRKQMQPLAGSGYRATRARTAGQGRRRSPQRGVREQAAKGGPTAAEAARRMESWKTARVALEMQFRRLKMDEEERAEISIKSRVFL
jgi:hypothetical protein